jgi:hypothetical protein
MYAMVSSELCVGQYLTTAFPIHNGQNKSVLHPYCLLNTVRCTIKKAQYRNGGELSILHYVLTHADGIK